MGYRLGIDVGGTFTDLLLFHEETGRIWRAKTPSTPADQSVGVLAGINEVCKRAGIHKDLIDSIIHGTTVGTNAVLEGKGGRVGLITTIGFEQILHLARGQTPGPLAGWMIMMKPDPRASLEDTVEAHERMDARGHQIRALDEREAPLAVRGGRAALQGAERGIQRNGPQQPVTGPVFRMSKHHGVGHHR